MNRKKNLWGFVCGVLTTVVVFGCVSSALAASSGVSYNSVALKVNGKKLFSAGEQLKTDAGQSIPSSILYTDAKGGGTTYLPLAYVSRLLDTPVTWDGKTGTVILGNASSGGSVILVETDEETMEKELEALPTTSVGSVAAPFKEIKPKSPGAWQNKIPMISKTEFTSQDDYEWIHGLDQNNGKYFSVTVTNHNDFPLTFALGRQYNLTSDKIYTHIPVGGTVTRTIEIQDFEKLVSSPQCLVYVSYAGGLPKDMHITIEGVQFD